MTSALSDDEIEKRFYVSSRMEILSLLNDLIHRRETVSVNFNGGREFILTTLLEARPDALVFDVGSDHRANARLAQAKGSVFVARPEGVRVQFAGRQASRFSWGGSDAFRIPLPEKAVRMQRRESYRIPMPIANPLTLSFFAESNPERMILPIHDLSVGGMGLTVKGMNWAEAGQTLTQAHFRLPHREAVECAGIVRHLTQLSEGRHGPSLRLGFSFSDLPRAIEVAIQRYIIEIEHERRELLGR